MEAGTLPRVAPASLPTLTPRLLRLASDSRLVGLVREGRDGAFEVIYDRHHRGILSFCRHMLGDADEAEDAVQHTFMAAYSDLRASNKPIHLRAWLFTIARNRCYTILRSRREHPAAEIDEAVTEGLASQVQRRQDLRDLVSDMRQLPEEQRAALVLAELDSLSHADIADVLGVPREKVKALVFQARESLLASRTARDTACAEIREQLSCGRGATLRRANLRRHLRDCEGCRAYRAQVDRQRKSLAALLPVVPGIALKEAVLSGTGVTAGAAAIGGGVIASSALKGGVLKGVVGVIVASLSTAGTLVVASGNVHVGALLHNVVRPFEGAPAPARPAAGSRPVAVHSSSTAAAPISFTNGGSAHRLTAAGAAGGAALGSSATHLHHARGAGAAGARMRRQDSARHLAAAHRSATAHQPATVSPPPEQSTGTAPVTASGSGLASSASSATSAPVSKVTRTVVTTVVKRTVTTASPTSPGTSSPVATGAPVSGAGTGSSVTKRTGVVRAPTGSSTIVTPGSTGDIGSSHTNGGMGSRYAAGSGGATGDPVSSATPGTTPGSTGTTRGASGGSGTTAGSSNATTTSTSTSTTTTTTATTTTPASTTTTSTTSTTTTPAGTTTTSTPPTTTSPTTGDIGSGPGSGGGSGGSGGGGDTPGTP